MALRFPLLLLRSVGIGLSVSTALGGLAFAAAPFFDAIGLYIIPAKLTVPVIMFAVPRLVYQMDADGGPAAGILVVIASAAFFWSVVFAVTFYVWTILRRGRAANGSMTANSR